MAHARLQRLVSFLTGRPTLSMMLHPGLHQPPSPQPVEDRGSMVLVISAPTSNPVSTSQCQEKLNWAETCQNLVPGAPSFGILGSICYSSAIYTRNQPRCL